MENISTDKIMLLSVRVCLISSTVSKYCSSENESFKKKTPDKEEMLQEI